MWIHIIAVVSAFALFPGETEATACLSSTMNIPLNNTKIIFNSPGFPADYPKPSSCKWLLTAQAGEVINYRILTFDVFPSIFCLKDILEIYDGDSKYSPVMQAWCGTRPSGETIQTSTQYSLISFQAVTSGDNRQGFEFEVWSETQYLPGSGDADISPVHLVLFVVFAAVALVFIAYTVVIVMNERKKKRLKEALDAKY